MSNFSKEINDGERFNFGKNWARFFEVLDEDRIREAEASLQEMLNVERLDGLKFLDIGSGSGLFSLAAWRLGASVHSFDYDPHSVATTLEMRRRYCNNNLWEVEEGSALDAEYLSKLGQFDIVYSWGVLHHTGNMWRAMKNVCPLVIPGGQLFIAIYNDQGIISRFWARVKKLYCSNPVNRIIIILLFFPVFAFAGFLSDILQAKNPLKRFSEYRKKRGMSITHDWVDWLGGYPYEYAKPEEIFEFYYRQGFNLTNLSTRQSLGCNQFVFIKNREV